MQRSREEGNNPLPSLAASLHRFLARPEISLRLTGSVLAALSGTPLVLAVFLQPAAQGHGTHEQLGMPACGWAVFFGKPCATCGMTTAFAHAVRLDLGQAALVQPFGLLLAILCGVLFWVGAHSAATGSVAANVVGRGLARPWVLWGMAGLAGLAWAYKWLTWAS